MVEMKPENFYEVQGTCADFEDVKEEEDLELFSSEGPTKMMDRAYQKVSPGKCAEAQSHLSAEER